MSDNWEKGRKKPSTLMQVPRKIKQQVVESSKTDLASISHKDKMSVIDYAVILASLYGIGAAIGIVSGAAANIMPEQKDKPNLYTASVLLIAFGAWRGYKTVSQFKNFDAQLQKESALEKKLKDVLPDKYEKYLYTQIK